MPEQFDNTDLNDQHNPDEAVWDRQGGEFVHSATHDEYERIREAGRSILDKPSQPDHIETNPEDEPDDKPVYCWCVNYRGKHKWQPNGNCPKRKPDGKLTTAEALDALTGGPEDPRTPRDPETGAPAPEPRRERPEPEPLPNESPWFPHYDAYKVVELDPETGAPMIVDFPRPTQATTKELHEADDPAVAESNTADDKEPGELPGMWEQSDLVDGWADTETGEPSVPEPTKEIQRWADVAMWKAPEHTDPQKPRVVVSMVTPDPLGVMAMVNAQYTGRNLTSPSQVTDAERREAFEAGAVSRLSETPMEWVQFSINFENVSRAFTHQLVRTRVATYAQESQRFAVKDNIDDAVKLPPSLAGTTAEWRKCGWSRSGESFDQEQYQREVSYLSKQEQWREQWDNALRVISATYEGLVNTGMPAEDARGLLPTNMLTRVHMRVDLKTLLGLAGMRLCTQAQFEWRAVFAELAKAIRIYGTLHDFLDHAWQYDLIASRFRPVCYAANRCTMKAKSDRACSIRAQVDAFEAAGVKSDRWEDDEVMPGDPDEFTHIRTIRPEQWLADPTAARVAP